MQFDFEGTKANIIKKMGKDPETKSEKKLKHIDEIEDEKHNFYLLLYGSLKWIFRFGVIFLLLLFFVILPISEMEFYTQQGARLVRSWIGWIQEWARAFIQTSSTVLIGLATLIVSVVLTKLFEFAKRKVEN